MMQELGYSLTADRQYRSKEGKKNSTKRNVLCVQCQIQYSSSFLLRKLRKKSCFRHFTHKIRVLLLDAFILPEACAVFQAISLLYLSMDQTKFERQTLDILCCFFDSEVEVDSPSTSKQATFDNVFPVFKQVHSVKYCTRRKVHSLLSERER